MTEKKVIQKEKVTTRQLNYDLLRVICAIAVILVHVSGTYVNAVKETFVFGDVYKEHIFMTSFCYTMSRFAVPCFVMMSGAFILDNNKNGEYRYFYRKSFKSIGILTIVFSLFYLLYSLGFEILALIVNGGSVKGILKPFKMLLCGVPYYHMWYLFMIIGVYIMAPVVIRVKNDIGFERFSRLAWVFLVLASISLWTSEFEVKWNLGYSFCYLGYFMTGYVLKQGVCKKETNNIHAMILIALGLLVEIVPTYLFYKDALAEIIVTDGKYAVVEPFSPYIVVASLLIFSGFAKLNVKTDLKINICIEKISALSFLIYLIHPFIWDLMAMFLKKTVISDGGDNRIVIPVCTFIVFGLSYIASVFYDKLWKKIDINDRVTNMIINKFIH